MCDYLKFLQNGRQMGSGPAEAMRKVLTYRLKDPGMRWDRPGVDAIMALDALQQSNTMKNYCRSRKHAAYPCRKVRPHPEKFIDVHILT